MEDCRKITVNYEFTDTYSSSSRTIGGLTMETIGIDGGYYLTLKKKSHQDPNKFFSISLSDKEEVSELIKFLEEHNNKVCNPI